MQWLWVKILAHRALRQRQCTLEGTAYVNIQVVYLEESVECGGVYTGVASFSFITIDQSKKCLMTKWPPRVKCY